MSDQVTIRYFAGAGAAAGVAEEAVVLTDGATTTAVLDDAVRRRGGDLGRVLTACSILVDGVPDRDRTRVLAAGTTVDVLPPFAGG